MRVIAKDGSSQEFLLSLDHYRAATHAGMSLPQYINNTVETDAEKYGTPYEQLLESAGMYVREDRALGIRPPSAKKFLTTEVEKQMGGAIVRPDGSQALTISGRLMFVSTILEIAESALRTDNASYAAVWNQLIATTQSLDSPRVDWPVINLSGPRTARSQQIAQLATPVNMAQFTLSTKSARMPVYSIGLEIADQALEAATIDLLGLIIREQAEAERGAIIDEAIVKLVGGDLDWGLAALSSETAATYDSSITAAGTMSHKAWIKWLSKDYRKMMVDWVICDQDTYLAIQNRSDRPIIMGDQNLDGRINVGTRIVNPGMFPDEVKFFIVDTAVIGANTLVGIDSRKAIKKWVWAGASYEAIESYVLRRSQAFRFDFSEAYTRIFDEAFKVLTLTV